MWFTNTSRLLHGGVDRNFAFWWAVVVLARRFLHGGVDRNNTKTLGEGSRISRLLHGGVDRNVLENYFPTATGGRLLHGASKHVNTLISQSGPKSPPSRGRGSKPLRFWRDAKTAGRLLHGGVDRNTATSP
jgi:hypothetical protein